MFNSFLRTVTALAITGLLCWPAAAADSVADMSASAYNGLCVLLVAIAVVMAAYYAHNAFETPIATPDDGPAPPRYMTQPRQYRMGMFAYVGLCLIGYVLIVGFYKDLAPFLAPVAPPPLKPYIQAYVQGSPMSFPVVVVLAVAALVTLLKIEHEWNPLYVLRRLVWGWVSIPDLANQIMAAARNDLVVPAQERVAVASEPANHVDSGDFDKDRQSVDRTWAELCYVRLWLTRKHDQGPHLTFFNEPSFAWQGLETNYKKIHGQIVPLKQALNEEDTPVRELFEETAAKIETLRRQYCRLAALFIVFENDTKKTAIRDANQFGARVGSVEARANPMRYVMLFIVAILISINLGVWLSAALWDLAHPAAAASALGQEANVATRWVYYGLATYGAPIIVVLLLRYLGWSYDAEQPSSYLTSYAAIFVIALCVSVTSLALATEFGPGPSAGKPFLDLLSMDFKWGWSPALICVYVVYHVDRQIDPLLPDIGTLGGEGVGQRLAACMLFAVLATLFALSPTASIPARPDSEWPVEKLHMVVIGTIFIIGFVMALVSQFCLVKPTKARAGSGSGVVNGMLRAS